MKPLVVLLFAALGLASTARAEELVYLDERGVVRWRADDAEVALFGANYNLPWSSDYRAAGRAGADRKQLVEQDFAHFARMGWDGVRLATWGDWESCDREGNLIVNDHIDVFDYAILQAKRRGIYVLFNPIHTYSAWWPDADPQGNYPGFAAHLEKRILGTDPAAIKAQQNYIRQFLEHVNPYTGVALKDEPQILFVEMINEPWHHPEDFAGSVDYINALVQAVRDTGCEKLTFHNISQTFDILPPSRASLVDGGSFGWYPTGLNLNRALTGNHLRSVDDYDPLMRPEGRGWPLIVYEFDSADMDTGFMYPAMARAMRGVGAQFAAMFSYDMLATAPTNGGWQTHWLSLVHSPKKALSAVVAAEVMRRVPMYSRYGDYPRNTRFGDFRVSYAEDLGELVARDVLLHTGDTTSAPPDPAALRRIAGRGDSPLVRYEGSGAYFFDQLAEGVWRLEVFPDAEMVADPFGLRWDADTIASRLVSREWPMTVALPDLGDRFHVVPLNSGNTHAPGVAAAGGFVVRPGVYLLSRDEDVDIDALPAHVGHLGLREHVVLPDPALPPQIIPRTRATFAADEPVEVRVDVVHPQLAREVAVIARSATGAEHRFVLPRRHRYTYAAHLPVGALGVGEWRLGFGARVGGEIVALPPDSAEAATVHVVAADAPLVLFDGGAGDLSRMFTSRGSWELRRQVFPHLGEREATAFHVARPADASALPPDLTAALPVKERVRDRAGFAARAGQLRVELTAHGEAPPVVLTLLERDGTAWTTTLAAPADAPHVDLPLDALRLNRGVLLPQGFPNNWSYWVDPAADRGAPGDRVRLEHVEQVQFSLRGADADVSAAGSLVITRITAH